MSAKCGMACCWVAVSASCRAVPGWGIEPVLVVDVSSPVGRAVHICPFGGHWLFDEYRIGFPLYFREDGRGHGDGICRLCSFLSRDGGS